MRVGVIREVKVAGRRVALTPAGARELVARGHEVLVETGGAAPITSTPARTNATLPYVLRLASDDLERTLEDSDFAPGLSVRDGEIVPVRQALEQEVAA